MQTTGRIDPFFDRQPPMSFIDELRRPLHEQKPPYYGKRDKKDGEIDVKGIYLANRYPDDPDGLLETVYCDLDRFFSLYEIGGDRFPIVIKKGKTEKFEAYVIEIAPDKITVTANDTEGMRRALIYIEDELRRREGAFLEPCTIKRAPHIRRRITRCFFSPINRPPKNGDELSDDIDYYPEEYLNRLMHDGANGVWIYTRFSDLVPSSYIEEYGQGYEPRIEKLNRVIEKCRRYGIGVYIFAIEPIGLTGEMPQKYPEMCGIPTYAGMSFCVNIEKNKKHCFEAGQRLATLAPKLAGFISITYGERPTGCTSSPRFIECPRCGKKSHGEALADLVEALRAGFRAANPECEVISWTYGARARMMHSDDWKKDISDYVRLAPDDVMLMQNFDDMGYEEQLGELRQSEDYWLSYVGPSELFTHTADQAKIHGKHLFAKMQVCCSHEMASVPYIPVPGLIYKKYERAYKHSVEGVLQCWYFGNYPSLMSKAAGELAFEDFKDENAFLTRLAGIYWGQSKAPETVRAWRIFENAYRNYPLNIMFSYYGPAHDGVVWKLQLKPKNLPLSRSWLGVDPADGDRIGECLLNGHTLDEVCQLAQLMRDSWIDGVKILDSLDVQTSDEGEQRSVAKAIELLLNSTGNVLEFYRLRDLLGRKIGDPAELLSRMRSIAEHEIENSTSMIPLCENDGRLGYHSEAEGYKFFPDKLRDRIEHLKTLLDTEFDEVVQRIKQGLSPLEYYEGIDNDPDIKRYSLKAGKIENANWEVIGDDANSRFRLSYDSANLYIELSSDDNRTFTLAPEFRLLYPDAVLDIRSNGTVSLRDDAFLYNSLFGDRRSRELAKYENIRALNGDGTHLLLTLKLSDIALDEMRPFKLKIKTGGVSWCQSPAPKYTLGHDDVLPEEYGWIIPEK